MNELLDWLLEADPEKAKRALYRIEALDRLAQAGVNPEKLRFVRWLVETGRLTDAR